MEDLDGIGKGIVSKYIVWKEGIKTKSNNPERANTIWKAGLSFFPKSVSYH